MKKKIILLLAFGFVWALAVFISYLLNRILNQDWFNGWSHYLIIGLAGALASIFAPLISAKITGLTQNKS